MNGPCLCGDPYCSSCGNPAAAEQEAAEEWAVETMSKASLTPDEYRTVVSVGLAAVAHARKAGRAVEQRREQYEAEAKLDREMEAGAAIAQAEGLL